MCHLLTQRKCASTTIIKVAHHLQKCVCVFISWAYCVCIVIGEFTYVLRVSSGSFLVIIPVSGSTVVKIHLHNKYTPDRVLTKHAASSKYIRDECIANTIPQNPREEKKKKRWENRTDMNLA